MRIATYNLWNSTFNWAQRLGAIVEELTALNADIVAIQEAPMQATESQPLTDFLREQTGYPHALHLAYPEEPDEDTRPEGLAFLSKLAFENARANWEDDRATSNNWAVKVVVDRKGAALGVTNVHLDWRQAASREQHIVRIVRELIDERPCDYDILCGDFNDGVDCLVARFLEGKALIGTRSTQWRDLDYTAHAARAEAAQITMDFPGNPRWKGGEIDGASGRFDRIYLRSGGSSRDLRVLHSGLFAKEPTNRFGIVPSDHYGVFVDLDEPRPRRPG